MSNKVINIGRIKLVPISDFEMLLLFHYGVGLSEIVKVQGLRSHVSVMVSYYLRVRCGVAIVRSAHLLGFKHSGLVHNHLKLAKEWSGQSKKLRREDFVLLLLKWNDILEPYRRSRTVQERNAGWLARRAKKRAKKRALKAKRKEKGKG